MNKIIPILPCPDITAQVEFFKNLGFEQVGLYAQPNTYAVVKYGDIVLHFWVNKKQLPADNPTMCILQVDDANKLCDIFSANLKNALGKIPRAGIPKITKIRELKDDRRFTLTDTGGNTFYVLTPKTGNEDVFLRTLQNEKYAKDFALLYDLMYSHESPEKAARLLPKLLAVLHELDDLDKAKLQLIVLDINTQTNQPFDDNELVQLLEANREKEVDWNEIVRKYGQLKEAGTLAIPI